MKLHTICWLAAATLAVPTLAQDVWRLYDGPAPGSEGWTHQKKEYYSELYGNRVVTNLVDPILRVYLPQPEKRNGTSVIVCPGGGFHALSIDTEGTMVAEWLRDRGVAAFVLEYRVVPTGEDGVQEMFAKAPETARADMERVYPLAVADGQAAVRLVRSKAEELDLRPDRVGMIGFSAGGAVVTGVALSEEAAVRPDFVAPIYPGAASFDLERAPDHAPPMFLLAATDDPLGLAEDIVALYSAWLAAGKSVELHLFSKGGHGFGMKTQGLPSDNWIELFGDWLEVQGLLEFR